MKTFKYRKTILALLVIVAGIWGGIIYRVVEYTRGDSVGQLLPDTEKSMISIQEDTLLLNYRDPFLGEISGKSQAAVGLIERRSEKAELEVPPSFQFAGKIKKGKQSHLVIRIDGEIRLVDERTKKIEGYRVEKIYADSLLVSRGKNRYTLRMDR